MSLGRGSSAYSKGLARLWNEGTLTGLGSGALLERYATNGDEAAFETLVALHGPMVLGLCRRMLADPRDVEDAFQAVFLILARKAGRLRDPDRLSNWLYGVAYKVAARARAQAARSRARETLVAEFEDRPAGPVSLADRVGPALDQELSRLPEKYRSALLLCYLKGRTHDQAAQELACPVGTVRSRLARGRDLLRKRLLRRGFAPAVAVLEGGSSSIRGLGEAVSASLLSRTTQAAVQFGSFKSVPAAAGAVALTQGVLLSMKIASLKVAAVTVVVAGLGVSAGGMAASRMLGGAPSQDPAAARPDPKAKPQASAPSLEDRMKTIESKLDALLSREGEAPGPAITETRPPRNEAAKKPAQAAAARSTATSEKEPFERIADGGPITNRMIRELEAQLRLDLISFAQYKVFRDRRGISQVEFELERGKGLVVLASLRGIAEDLEEEIAINKDRTMSCQYRIDVAKASMEAALAVVARNTRLNQRKPGMIAQEDFLKDEAEFKVAESRAKALMSEFDALRSRQNALSAKLAAVKKIIELGKPLEAREPEAAKP